jgi:hypothetical protein
LPIVQCWILQELASQLQVSVRSRLPWGLSWCLSRPMLIPRY